MLSLHLCMHVATIELFLIIIYWLLIVNHGWYMRHVRVDKLSRPHTHTHSRQTQLPVKRLEEWLLKRDKQSTKGEGNWHQSSVAPHPNDSSYANAHMPTHTHMLIHSHSHTHSQLRVRVTVRVYELFFFTHIRLSCGIQPRILSVSSLLSASFALRVQNLQDPFCLPPSSSKLTCRSKNDQWSF